MKTLTLVLLSVWFFCAEAREFHEVKMQDSVKVGDKNLQLNGMALRKVKRFGMFWKVYVAGLYVAEKSDDGEAIINSDSVKQVIMEYKRSVQRGSIVDGWKTGFKKACRLECDSWSKQYEKFIEAATDAKKGSRTIITIYPDKVQIENKGTNKDKVFEVPSKALGKNIMSIFIDKKNPPSQRFRNEMLGMEKES